MALLLSTWLYINLSMVYFILLYIMALLDCTAFYHSSISLYLTLHYSTMALCHSTWLYCLLPKLYFTILGSTLLYNGSTLLYLTPHYSTMAVFHSSFLYINLASANWLDGNWPSENKVNQQGTCILSSHLVCRYKVYIAKHHYIILAMHGPLLCYCLLP